MENIKNYFEKKVVKLKSEHPVVSEILEKINEIEQTRQLDLISGLKLEKEIIKYEEISKIIDRYL